MEAKEKTIKIAVLWRFSVTRIKELEVLKKYARDQFSTGMIESQIKYWQEAKAQIEKL